MGHKTSKSPYESQGREARCCLCGETKDEKAVKIFVYWGKNSGHELHINVCRSCENKEEELGNLAKEYFKK